MTDLLIIISSLAWAFVGYCAGSARRVVSARRIGREECQKVEPIVYDYGLSERERN